ncbi:Rrf2 family transcriptional regulator [Ochrobactrum sp. AN78]|uniref:Rrf2 family transcriptional regulator n=1 Tax=Ochrobactrum sp. AN78 TaxID=3039853 RepID=UPI0021F77172|nr:MULTISPECIES: Rrf2 family transcriptional regulator [Brucella/Ochrobactrum group]MCV9909459.1 Rrf2 family transcriptional regulator [Brucella sp. HL-2]MDH7791145.1 Rrf2 family nitric oxide-sensitive transcriptional repressor [Ochrobactrum sp. AN78]
MRFTRQAELSIEFLVLCARASAGSAVTTRTAAEATGTTKDHAAQIVSELIHHGFLVGSRGRGGGIRLARPAKTINVGTVLRLMQPGFNEQSTKQSGSDSAFGMLLQAAMRSFVAAFDDFTIADLAIESSDGRLACLDCDLRSLIHHGQMLSELRRRSDHAEVPAWASIS